MVVEHGSDALEVPYVGAGSNKKGLARLVIVRLCFVLVQYR